MLHFVSFLHFLLFTLHLNKLILIILQYYRRVLVVVRVLSSLSLVGFLALSPVFFSIFSISPFRLFSVYFFSNQLGFSAHLSCCSFSNHLPFFYLFFRYLPHFNSRFLFSIDLSEFPLLLILSSYRVHSIKRFHFIFFLFFFLCDYKPSLIV